jgi:hypothetical protein
MIFQSKGTQAFCKNCNALLFVLAVDVSFGEPANESMLEPNLGQCFKFMDRCVCKKCGHPFDFTGPNHSDSKAPWYMGPET